MAPSIGLNLRVTGYCNQGGRKYMEDVFSVAYQQTEDEKDLEYAFFGIFDGHGGREAAVFAKEHLMDFIVRQKSFWSDDDENVLRAIKEGFIQTHQAMWKELENWPKTASGLPSTAGTTASIAFIRRGKIYIGHVGDSAIVLGVQHPENPDFWTAKPLTRDHKPESLEESRRIQQSGGKVVCKSGVPRVVWNRPKVGHRGMVRRSTLIDEIPFLAVARSLGDLWSYNSEEDVFVVSPEPDTYVYPIDITKHRCLILGTDGVWNMLSPAQAVLFVCQSEKSNEQHMIYPQSGRQWINPSKRLVDRAIEKWNGQGLRADNTSVVTVMLDPPGPPRAQVLKRQRELAQLNQGRSGISPNHVNADRGSVALVTNTTQEDCSDPPQPARTVSSVSGESKSPDAAIENVAQSSNASSSFPPKTAAGIALISRLPNSKNKEEAKGHNLVDSAKRNLASSSSTLPNVATSSTSKILHDFQTSGIDKGSRKRPVDISQVSVNRAALNRLTDSTSVLSRSFADSSSGNIHHNYHFTHRHHHHSLVPQQTSSTAGQPEPDIQCNEISSSDDDSTPTKTLPHALPARKSALKESRLSRELNALQSASPKVKLNPSLKRSHSANTSDAENDDVVQKRRLRSSLGSQKPFVDVEVKCRELNAKIQKIERKVAQETEQLSKDVKLLQSTLIKSGISHFLRSSTPASRSLRPRSGLTTPGSASSIRKRKLLTCDVVHHSASKNLKRSPVPIEKKPVVTRSKKARVLQLKK